MKCLICKNNKVINRLNFICKECYDIALNIKCNKCSNKINFDYNFYLSYPDLKLNLKNKTIALIEHWIKFGYNEQRKCSDNMEWINNNIVCKSCDINNNIVCKSDDINNNIICKSDDIKKNILIMFNTISNIQKEKLQNILNNFNKEKYNFTVENNFFEILNPGELGPGPSRRLAPNDREYKDLLNYDIYIYGNISNYLHTYPNHYEFAKHLIYLKKKIAIVHITTCIDYYCPSTYDINNYCHSKFMNFKPENFVKDINLFLPNFHYNNLITVYSDSYYNEKFYKENPKFLLDPILVIPNLLSKNEFLKYYDLNENVKIVVYYCGRSDELFQYRPEHEQNKRIKKVLGDKYNIWDIYETSRQTIYNINKLNKILKLLGYTLMIKLHRDEDKHFLWGKTCFRDDINDKNLSPFANIECPIVKHEHFWEILEYSKFAISSSESSINWILSDLEIPCIYFTSKYKNKCWIKFLNEYLKTNIYNNLLYGNIYYIEDVINDNKLLDDNMKNIIKNFINCESYDNINLFKFFNINKNSDDIVKKFTYIINILK